MRRRDFLARSAGLLAFVAAPALADAPIPSLEKGDVPNPYDWNSMPPTDSRQGFIDWMVKNRGENPTYLGERFDRFQALLHNKDVWDDKDKRAFLMTPREDFVLAPNLPRAYSNAFLDINYGVTISGPHLVGRMTSSIDVQKGEKVLEVGTGSGYQSAYLSNLTDKVWTIEIIKPLFERTGGIYDDLIAHGYTELKSVTRKNDDGYYGWQEAGPFDKIIVTCGIDHVPPPLLQQLQPNGIMVIPVGPPGAQHVLKIIKEQTADGSFRVARSDIYNGRIVNFVPFTKLVDGKIIGTHNGK
jgi:protein-L-isoaspartate(D-aspartate) O-methyltransferase